ncbi:hypothetical protein V8G54_005535 [Vigna mungo]|uniref:Reverse transcriptase domain-containing protein n=1 Tax=Vigna mungo TaxID=3915 RepID=A0AAQ3S6I1_VIGMU
MQNDTDARLEAIEITMEGMNAESAAVRRDLQQIMKILDTCAHQTEGNSDDSSVNDNQQRVVGGHEDGRTSVRGMEQKPWRKKVELLTFDGEEPLSWLSRAERFFDIQKVTNDEDKVEVAYVSMEGSAAYWFTFWKEKARNRSWDGLKTAMINCFGGGFRGTVFERLATLRQEGTVEEFVRSFEVLTSHTRGIPEEQVLRYFLAGLREDVKGQVRIQNPPDLMEAMRVARDVEDAMVRSQGNFLGGVKINPMGSRSVGIVTQVDPNRMAMTQTGRTEGVGANPTARGNATTGADNRGRTVRNLPYPEFLKRKEEGRCYRCAGPFAPGHSCPEKSLRILLLAEDEEEDETEGSTNLEEKPMEHSACSAEGLTTPKTLKLKGRIGDKEIVVLIDSGASHNYMSKELTEELRLPVMDTPTYAVSLGDGHKKITQGRCERVTIRLEGVDVEEEFFVFELGGVDVILGVAWLAKLGEVRTNYGKMTMEYQVGEKKIQIRGDPALTRQLVKPKSILKVVDADSWVLVWNLCEVEKEENREWGADSTDVQRHEWETDLTGEQRRELDSVLQAHSRIFCDMQGLPSTRRKEYRIQLKEGVDPINVRPYRYPHFLKGEIERQVEDMLRAGVIRPSSSPFSSPVILVKKKDESWRFCVDYRALNKATVPDKFPIPVIEELLDELKGARYFSKIDLKSGYHQIRMEARDNTSGPLRVLGNALWSYECTGYFSKYHEQLIEALSQEGVLAFFDDILVYSPSWPDHVKQLGMVLQQLEKDGWVANQKKCEFGRKKIRYMGHQISEQGVEMDSEKTKVVMEGFLGLTGYYRRFVAGYGKLAKPLTELLKKGKFEWSTEARRAMDNLKAALITPQSWHYLILIRNFTLSATLQVEDFSHPTLEAILGGEKVHSAHRSTKFEVLYGTTHYYTEPAKLAGQTYGI